MIGAFSLLLRRRVIVNLKSDLSFIGILFQQKGQLIVLKDVSRLEAGHEPQPVDGDVVFERGEVSFYEVLN